ncbi:probable anion transporter 6, chloroplastic isoform X3 [Salvia splendens]|uniref:probable anion transporter 6, chloroplastic isoform X3 n=1 Tax=Salvia splendens TaxID=180675 RepID=UPI001C27160E|nr:probable anion transporter 6, chloroplastic isoform X3 [Salvia splendens]
MAARIISNVDSNFFSFSYGTSIKTPIPRTQPLIGFPFKKRLNFEALCSIKEREREREIAAEKQGLASGVVVDDELKRKEGVGGEGFDLNWPPWKNLPQRYKLIGTTSLAFVICNMDKVNLSIAIIPMSHQFGWNASVAGLVQSSFFWGYALSQLPGGWLSKIFGGRRVLEVGVLVWSLATAMVPLLAGFMPGLVLSRVLVGIGEGVSPSAATDMIARTVPIEERSRAVSFVFGGLSFGSVLGLVLAPPLIEDYGWGSVFYIFGSLGIAWYLIFQVIKEDNLPFAASHQSWPQTGTMTKSWTSTLQDLGGSLTDMPWKEFFKSKAVWAMIYTHFCGSWGHYCCLSWLPTYFSEELDLDLTEAAWVSVLPPLASIFVTSIASQLADYWISNGVETTVVRKVCQTIAFMSPATCMILSSLDLGLSPWQVVAILTSGLALSSFALSGLYCTHQDISPEYASVLLVRTRTPLGNYQHRWSCTWNCWCCSYWLSSRHNSLMGNIAVCSINFLLPYRHSCMVGIS